MNETTARRVQSHAGALFVATVTTCLVAFVLTQMARGLPGVPAALLYAFAAGFGLEFLGSAWTGRWSTHPAPRRW